MNELLSQLVLATYYGILGILALYGAHRFFLLILYYRTRSQVPAEPPVPVDCCRWRDQWIGNRALVQRRPV